MIGYIDAIWVHKDYRGLGVGRTLLEEASKIAWKSGCKSLSVDPGEVIGFYRRC